MNAMSRRLAITTLLVTLFALNHGFVVAGTKPSVTAVEASPSPSSVAASPQPSMEQGKKDQYILPYPGILPDHPLYFIKRLRDFLLDKLVVDPVRKAELYILQADKRLNMGIFLVGKQKEALAEETISKGEKYLNGAVYGLLALKTTGGDVPQFVVERLEKSLAKHSDVVADLMTRVSEQTKNALRGSLELVTKLQGELGKLK